MKNFILFLTLSSSFAYGIDPHDGGGGTICIPDGQTSPRAVDDVFFGSPRPLNLKMGDKLRDVADSRVKGLRSVNLLETQAGIVARKKISLLEELTPKVAPMIMNSLLILSDVYVMDSTFKRPLGTPVSQNFDPCLPGTVRSVIATDFTGQTVLSKPDWDLLSLETQEILVIHEALRFAAYFQLSWSAKEEEIYELTMQLWEEDRVGLSYNPLLKRAGQVNEWEEPLGDAVTLFKRKALLNKEISEFLDQQNSLGAFFRVTQAKEFRLIDPAAPMEQDPYKYYQSLNVLEFKKNRTYTRLLPDIDHWKRL